MDGWENMKMTISFSLFTTFDSLLRWRIRQMKKTIKGEPVRVGVAMLVSAASSQVPVYLRLVYR